MTDRLLTTREVASLLAVAPSTVCRMRQQGSGPAVIWVTPSVPRYRLADVEAWLERVAAA